MTRIVTISLDEKSHAIWGTLPEKSKWVRQMLGHHALKVMGLEIRHYGTKAHREARGGLCNPDLRQGKCPICYPLEEE